MNVTVSAATRVRLLSEKLNNTQYEKTNASVLDELFEPFGGSARDLPGDVKDSIQLNIVEPAVKNLNGILVFGTPSYTVLSDLTRRGYRVHGVNQCSVRAKVLEAFKCVPFTPEIHQVGASSIDSAIRTARDTGYHVDVPELTGEGLKRLSDGLYLYSVYEGAALLTTADQNGEKVDWSAMVSALRSGFSRPYERHSLSTCLKTLARLKGSTSFSQYLDQVSVGSILDEFGVRHDSSTPPIVPIDNLELAGYLSALGAGLDLNPYNARLHELSNDPSRWQYVVANLLEFCRERELALTEQQVPVIRDGVFGLNSVSPNFVDVTMGLIKSGVLSEPPPWCRDTRMYSEGGSDGGPLYDVRFVRALVRNGLPVNLHDLQTTAFETLDRKIAYFADGITGGGPGTLRRPPDLDCLQELVELHPEGGHREAARAAVQEKLADVLQYRLDRTQYRGNFAAARHLYKFATSAGFIDRNPTLDSIFGCKP